MVLSSEAFLEKRKCPLHLHASWDYSPAPRHPRDHVTLGKNNLRRTVWGDRTISEHPGECMVTEQLGPNPLILLVSGQGRFSLREARTDIAVSGVGIGRLRLEEPVESCISSY